ncbi:MAG: hypothetical protein JNL70_10620 [Saprospiraceae bacterium]|nr:hypothetical protein [Saprospiraceae bacterium]
MKKGLLGLLPLSIWACTEQPKSTENTVAKVDSTTILNHAMSSNPDTLVVWADSTGNISFGDKKALTYEQLETVLADSLKAIKTLYHTKPDTIILKTKGDVLMGTRGAIRDVISDVKEKQ